MITLTITDSRGKSIPVNYRIYDKREGLTKKRLLPEMVAEALA